MTWWIPPRSLELIFKYNFVRETALSTHTNLRLTCFIFSLHTLLYNNYIEVINCEITCLISVSLTGICTKSLIWVFLTLYNTPSSVFFYISAVSSILYFHYYIWYHGFLQKVSIDGFWIDKEMYKWMHKWVHKWVKLSSRCLKNDRLGVIKNRSLLLTHECEKECNGIIFIVLFVWFPVRQKKKIFSIN